jgi:transcription antitermination factor NusG
MGFTTSEHGLRWFALQVRPRYEKIVASVLRAKGYEAFLPLTVARRRWSDRTKALEVPLFPGYLFCRLDPLVRLPILLTPGVLSIVGVGKNPVPVEASEIEAVQAIVESGIGVEAWPWLEAGQRVRIEQGPLTGLEGILVDFKNSRRLVVSVTLLQRSVSAEIERDWVRPTPSPAAPALLEPSAQFA